MSPIFKLGQVLRGRLTKYVITKEVQETVWLAKNQKNEQRVVIKSVRGHFRVENERDILQRFQGRTPYLRPLIDEIEEPREPITIVLKYLDDNLQNASNKRTLNRKELKYVSKRILEALSTLHEDGFVHTDVKLDNVLINYGQDGIRFTDVQLSDYGSTYHVDHKYAKGAAPIGAPIWRSPEAMLQLPSGWNTATDIWSFGLCLIALIYGADFHILEPRGVPFGHEDYEINILVRLYQFFGPFPPKYRELIEENEDINMIIQYLFEKIPQSEMKPFSQVSNREVSRQDKEFICKMMKMDPRERPTAKELLQDDWFKEKLGDEFQVEPSSNCVHSANVTP